MQTLNLAKDLALVCGRPLSRRQFVGACAAGLAAASVHAVAGELEPQHLPPGLDVPLVDLHVHRDNSTPEKILEIARQRGVRFGLVEHAGTPENQYPVVLSNDAQLGAWLKLWERLPVWRGVQAEYDDWTRGFSRQGLAGLDYILMDAMTFPGKDGQRVKLWEPDVESRVEMSDHQAFMDRFVDWHVTIIEKQPIDILANVSWLPKALVGDYDTYWTPARIRRVVEAAVRRGVALEISSSYQLPKLEFLQIAKAAGARFSFGSNGRYPKMGQLQYCLQMAQTLKLTRADVFMPGAGPKAVERWGG